MSNRAELVSNLPAGYKPCRHCAGEKAYTRIRPAPKHTGEDAIILAHWCDRGRRPTGRDAFVRGGPDRLADIQLIADDEDQIAETWNNFNA